jgi:ABC-type lipoprotein export system ATPase subunit
MSDSDIIIETFDLQRVYKIGHREVPALRGVSVRLEAGQFIALKGRSGSGKTTLLNCLSGLDRPTAGRVEALGQDLAKMDEKALTNWRRTQVGFIFQSFGLIPTLSAYENVELMMRIAGVPARERHARTLTVLGLMGLTKWIHHRPYELSGGQQQRVAIARALANKPRLLLADEPTGELDSTTGREILTLFRQVVEQEKLTLLMSSHDPMVDGFVDSILQMKDGQIVS